MPQQSNVCVSACQYRAEFYDLPNTHTVSWLAGGDLPPCLSLFLQLALSSSQFKTHIQREREREREKLKEEKGFVSFGQSYIICTLCSRRIYLSSYMQTKHARTHTYTWRPDAGARRLIILSFSQYLVLPHSLYSSRRNFDISRRRRRQTQRE